MTPEEKADELIDKMYYTCRYDDLEDYIPAMAWERAKQCALIAVTEIIKEHYPQDAKRCEYWNQVKTEIEKI